MFVPHVEVPAGGKLDHAFAGSPPNGQKGAAAVFQGEGAVAPGNGETGRQPLDVPFPWARQGLVEVVHVEDEPALRRPESPEGGQVGVSTALDPLPVSRHTCRSQSPMVRSALGFPRPGAGRLWPKAGPQAPSASGRGP